MHNICCLHSESTNTNKIHFINYLCVSYEGNLAPLLFKILDILGALGSKQFLNKHAITITNMNIFAFMCT